jgi:DNA repair protein RadC
MTVIQRLIGEEDKMETTKIIRLRSMKSVFERQVIREDAPGYIITTRFTSPQQVFEMFLELQCEAREHFITLHLDGKSRIVCFDRVSVGSLNQSIVHPREVFQNALLSSAASIILIHNHPTGDSTPSSEDIQITQRLVEGGKLLGIQVLDHIIIGAQYLSFAERGLL